MCGAALGSTKRIHNTEQGGEVSMRGICPASWGSEAHDKNPLSPWEDIGKDAGKPTAEPGSNHEVKIIADMSPKRCLER